jgi:hypothetical protein
LGVVARQLSLDRDRAGTGVGRQVLADATGGAVGEFRVLVVVPDLAASGARAKARA